MLIWLFTGWAFAQGAPDLPTPDELMAMADAETRHAALRAVIHHPDSPYGAVARATAASKILEHLDTAQRTDAAVVRGFLQAALQGEEPQRLAAIHAAKQGGLPPPPPALGVSPAPAAEEEEPTPDFAALRAYRDRRLYTGSRAVVMGSMSGSATGVSGWVTTVDKWTVYQGAQSLSARRFANLIENPAALTKLQRKNRTVGTATGVLAIASLASAVGAVQFGNDEGGSPASAVLALGSVLTGSVAIGLPLGFSLRNSWVGGAFEAPETNEWIAEYNDDLREELGLSERDVSPMDLGTVR